MQKGQRFVALEFYEVIMIYLFRDLKIKYIITKIVIISAVCGLALWSLSSENIDIFSYLICMALLALILALYFLIVHVLNLAATKNFNCIMDILQEECDPYKYIEHIIPLTQQKLQNNTKVTILLCLASGYIDSGDTNQAKAVLSDITKIGTSNMINLANICNIWTVLYLSENDTKNAQLALADLWRYINLIKSDKAKCLLTKTYNRQAAKINMFSNKIDGIEEIYKSQLESSETLIEKNILYFECALLYIKQNRIDEAKQALQFVIANGNKLYLVKQAKEKLALL